MNINIEEGESTQQSFFFEPIQNKLVEDKSAKEIFLKWGLGQTLKIGSFRYNQHFQEYEIDRFMKDLFNNPNVRYIMTNINFQQSAIGSVQFDKLRCHQLSMEIFDTLEAQQIVKKGYIQKIMPDYHEEIQIVDKLRQCLVVQESQNFCIFNETQRQEFLMKLFQLLVIGGSFNQYEDVLQPYLEWTKSVYKSLVSVRKRAETKQLFIQTLAYKIKSMDSGKSYKPGYNPQNVLYVLINPSIRSVHILANEWKKFW